MSEDGRHVCHRDLGDSRALSRTLSPYQSTEVLNSFSGLRAWVSCGSHRAGRPRLEVILKD